MIQDKDLRLNPIQKNVLKRLTQPVAVKDFGSGTHFSTSEAANPEQTLLKEAGIFRKLGPSRALPMIYGLVMTGDHNQLVMELCRCNWRQHNDRGLIEVSLAMPTTLRTA